MPIRSADIFSSPPASPLLRVQRSLEALADALAAAIAPLADDLPYCVFGHSAGVRLPAFFNLLLRLMTKVASGGNADAPPKSIESALRVTPARRPGWRSRRAGGSPPAGAAPR